MFPLNKAFRFRFWPPLPSFRRHTHTLIHLKLAPPPLDYPSSDFPTLYASQAVLWPSLWSPPFICSIVKLVVSARQLIMIIMVAAAAAASPLSPYPPTKLLTLQCIHPLTMAQTPADPSTSPPTIHSMNRWQFLSKRMQMTLDFN